MADVLLSDGEDLSAKKREGFCAISAPMHVAQCTVENLLAITRLENGEVRLSTTTELLDDIVEEALRHVSPDSEFHDIEVEPSRDLLLVDVDARLMVQVVVNLLNNAVAYTQVARVFALCRAPMPTWPLCVWRITAPVLPKGIVPVCSNRSTRQVMLWQIRKGAWA